MNNYQKAKRTLTKLKRQQEEKLTQRKAKKMGLPYIELAKIYIDPEALGVLSKETARTAEMTVIHKKGKILKVALSNPENPKTVEVLASFKKEGFEYSLFVSSLSGLETIWQKYPQKIHKGSDKDLPISEEKLVQFEKEIRDISSLGKRIVKVPISELLETVLAGALKTRASDIHFEPKKNEVKIRFRIDGVLQDIVSIPREIYPPLVARIKLISGLKINVYDIPQDGRFSIVYKKPIDIRVSVVPSNWGETLVLRILGQFGLLEIDQLGLRPQALELMKREIKKPQGMILTTGPTGAGKTTTLFSFLKYKKRPEIKIVSLEDPIEYRLKGITQTQIDVEKGYTFPVGLKAILRQDPDVILVGEIRELETAEIATNAALTGHLVLSTLSTNSAAETIPRLTNMGLGVFVLAPSINIIIAQRLVRRICKKCAKNCPSTKKEKDLIKGIINEIPKNYPEHPKIKTSLKLAKGEGCAYCNFTGYRDRVGIFEILKIDKEVENLILSSSRSLDIELAARKKGMLSLREDGILKVLEQVTTLEEVERVTGLIK